MVVVYIYIYVYIYMHHVILGSMSIVDSRAI